MQFVIILDAFGLTADQEEVFCHKKWPIVTIVDEYNRYGFARESAATMLTNN